MLKQAAEWGIVADAKDGHDKVRLLVMAKAVAEYEKQHAAAMDAAWQAATAKPSDHLMTPSLAHAEAPLAEQNNKAMATTTGRRRPAPLRSLSIGRI